MNFVEVIIGDDIYSYGKDKLNIQDLFNHINSILNDKKYIFSHLLIDGVEVYQEHDKYILDNIEYIETIEVVYKTQREFVIDTWRMTIKFLDELLPQVEELIVDFYQNFKSGLWNRIIPFVENLDLILQSFNQIIQISDSAKFIENENYWALYVENIKQLNDCLPGIEKSMVNQDTIAMADSIKWEIHPLLLNMKKQLQNILEGVRQ